MDIQEKIKKNIDLKALTTFRIGGPAEYYVEVSTKNELYHALRYAAQKRIPGFIIGGGSNILVNDQGIAGLVVKLLNQDIREKGTRLECGAGAKLAEAVSLAVRENLTGLEWAAGIPGSVAGAVRGNAGAFGSNISDLVENVSIYDKKKDKFVLFSNRDCGFGYRQSVFHSDKGKIIWEVILKLEHGVAGEIQKKVGEYLESRRQGQPNFPSAGCVFKNISVDKLKNDNPELAQEAEERGVTKNGMLGAGWLIEKAGLKGKKIGGAKVSLEHGNFIVNTGNARAEDVVMLISFIKQQVRDGFGVQLMEEIEYFGF